MKSLNTFLTSRELTISWCILPARNKCNIRLPFSITLDNGFLLFPWINLDLQPNHKINIIMVYNKTVHASWFFHMLANTRQLGLSNTYKTNLQKCKTEQREKQNKGKWWSSVSWNSCNVKFSTLTLIFIKIAMWFFYLIPVVVTFAVMMLLLCYIMKYWFNFFQWHTIVFSMGLIISITALDLQGSSYKQ